MTDLKINLANFTKRFAENCKELLISKKVNFIFGKNGTGKSTIAKAIKDQFSSNYSVCIFDGFEGIVGENHRLEAIALGTENTAIQTQINIIDSEIAGLEAEIEKPTDNNENLFTKREQTERNCQEQENKIGNFYTSSARTIKNTQYDNVNVASPTYDRNIFKSEIIQAKQLTEDEIEKHRETIKSEKREIADKIVFPDFDLSECLKSVNSILLLSVSQHQIIEELKDNAEKQNFARDGMRIHNHKTGEKCAFCGNEISEERWQRLGSYFNDEVKRLEERIEQNIKKLDTESRGLSGMKEIDKNNFYKQFAEQIETLNLQIKNNLNAYRLFFENLKTTLEQKKKNLFAKSQELTVTIPNDFKDIKNIYEKIVGDNNDFSQNFSKEQEKAKSALRYHEIQRLLDTFNFDTENSNLTNLKAKQESAKETFDKKKAEFDAKKAEKNELILQTKDEKKIAGQINELLKNMGVAAFSLDLVKDEENQKGQYQIKRWYHQDGKFDDIQNLSKGEKNIIAFLYFLFALERVDDSTKPKIIVLDDPMTSNDDTMQYLMIGEIQKFYKTLKDNDDNFFVLLTHNCHFYLNIRNTRENKFYTKHGNFHLFSDGKQTTIRVIKDDNNDFKTNYEMLWKELLFLYEQDKPDLMLNCCRRICETYSKFNCKRNLYADNINAKKLFDVNQHSIDDLEAEQNGRTREDIINILKDLFKKNNAEEHFDSYFKI